MSTKKNLVKERTTTTGTGTLTLSALAGWARFSNAFANGMVVPYSIENGNNKEVGFGTVGASNTLARTTVLATLESGVYDDTSPTPITLAGESTVFCGALAELFDASEISGIVGVGLQAEGLVVTNGGTPTTQATVTADALIVYSATGAPARLNNVNVTATITTSGDNGLDTGTEAANTWYHIWVIWNGSTTASLLSTSATSPTMPSGYTHKQRVGVVRNNASSNFLLFRQHGTSVRYEERVTVNDGAFTNDAWTALSVTNFFPPTAQKVCFFAGYEGGQFGVSRRSDGFGGDYADAGQSNSSDTFGGVSPTARQNTASLTCLYGSSIYYYSETANSTLLALGWEF